MNPDLRSFIGSLARTLLPVVLAVATSAFVSIPLTLGHAPSDNMVARVPADGHMT